MSDLSDLDPNTRACALVGMFLQAWANMEFQLNLAIGKVFGLQQIQRAMLCSNLQFYDKINIIKTVVNLEMGEKNKSAINYNKMLEKIKKSSVDRNMMAHCQFCSNKDDTAVFWLVIKAKGKFQIPDSEWTEDKFFKKMDEIYQWRDGIKELQEVLTKVKMAQLLAESSSPNQVRGLLGLAVPPSLQPQADRK